MFNTPSFPVVPAAANVNGNGTIAPLTLTTATPTQPGTLIRSQTMIQKRNNKSLYIYK